MSTEVRCPTCNSLLAKQQSDGSFEIRKRGRVLVILYAGCLHCSCGDRVSLLVTEEVRDRWYQTVQ